MCEHDEYFSERAEFYEPTEEEKLREWGIFDGEITKEEDYREFWRCFEEAQSCATAGDVLASNDKQSDCRGGGYTSSADYCRRLAEGKRRGWDRPYPSNV